MHPDEVIAEIETRDGIEEVPVHESKIDGDMLLVSYPVGRDGTDVLVELPQESARGYWRVWVDGQKLERSAR